MPKIKKNLNTSRNVQNNLTEKVSVILTNCKMLVQAKIFLLKNLKLTTKN